MPVNDAVKARLNASLGVDGPLHIPYFKHMWGVLHFDFDVPFQSPGETVLELLAPQMVSIPVTRCDPKTLQQALIQRYSNEIPCFNWQDHTVVRLSAQGYNTLTDMDLLITALTDLLPELSAMT